MALSGELMLVGTENSVSLSLANWAIFRPSGTENNTELCQLTKISAKGLLHCSESVMHPCSVIGQWLIFKCVDTMQ